MRQHSIISQVPLCIFYKVYTAVSGNFTTVFPPCERTVKSGAFRAKNRPVFRAASCCLAILYLAVLLSYTVTRQPRVSGRLPHWMPVSSSYSFWVSSPMPPSPMCITSSS